MRNNEDTVFQLKHRTPRMRHIVAVSFGTNNITAWFNGDPYHAAPKSLSLVLNAIYKSVRGKNYEIQFVNAPLQTLVR